MYTIKAVKMEGTTITVDVQFEGVSGLVPISVSSPATKQAVYDSITAYQTAQTEATNAHNALVAIKAELESEVE